MTDMPPQLRPLQGVITDALGEAVYQWLTEDDGLDAFSAKQDLLADLAGRTTGPIDITPRRVPGLHNTFQITLTVAPK